MAQSATRAAQGLIAILRGPTGGMLACLLTASLLGGVAAAHPGAWSERTSANAPAGNTGDVAARPAASQPETATTCSVVLLGLASTDDARGLTKAIRSVRANCAGHPQAPGLLVALRHLRRNLQRGASAGHGDQHGGAAGSAGHGGTVGGAGGAGHRGPNGGSSEGHGSGTGRGNAGAGGGSGARGEAGSGSGPSGSGRGQHGGGRPGGGASGASQPGGGKRGGGDADGGRPRGGEAGGGKHGGDADGSASASNSEPAGRRPRSGR
jgi:hypothetical protein